METQHIIDSYYETIYLTNNYINGATDQYIIEEELGLYYGQLDTTLNNTKDATDATEGSAMQIFGYAEAYDSFTFNYEYYTDDLDANDFSFFTVSGQSYKIADLEDVYPYGTQGGSFYYQLKESDIAEDGSFSFGTGVMDSGDYNVDSGLKSTI